MQKTLAFHYESALTNELHWIEVDYNLFRAEPDVGISSDYAELITWRAAPPIPKEEEEHLEERIDFELEIAADLWEEERLTRRSPRHFSDY